jgi:hypothetical protein
MWKILSALLCISVVNFYNFYFASGAIWTKMKTNFEWWEVDIIFRVTGRGRIGADGLVCIATLGI